jgi:hypothetical protein
VVALQWSLKMHGFGVHPPDELQALRRKVPQRNGAREAGGSASNFIRSVLNYELAKEFGGRCNLRLDDANPD